MTLHSISNSASPSRVELDSLAQSVARNLIASTPKIASWISFQITLLEVFKFEVKKLRSLGYCDYRLAYLAHLVNMNLVRDCAPLITTDMRKFLDQVNETLDNCKSDFAELDLQFEESEARLSRASIDPLAARLAQLKIGTANVANQSTLTFSKYRYSDSISASELNLLIRQQPDQILLLDFRSQKEYSYSHINFLNVVNIEPSILTSLSNNGKEISDIDLEGVLQTRLSPEAFKKFRDRQRFGLVVLYNLRYGGVKDDRFTSLERLLINNDNNGIPSSNPYSKLIEIMMYRTKYLSSQLKQYPVYLSGGLEKWFHTFGEGSLVREHFKNGDSAPSRTDNTPNFKVAPEKMSTSTSVYLRSFGDYLASANSNGPHALPSPAPLSNQGSDGYSRTTPSLFAPQNIGVNRVEFTSIQPAVSVQPVKNSQRAGPSLPVHQAPSRSVTKETASVSILKANTMEPEVRPVLRTFSTGLTNLGNSCYMNCILQCLGATPQLTKFFFPTSDSNGTQVLQSYRQHINMKNSLGTKGIVTTTFVTLLNNMFSNSGKYFSPNSFKQTVGNLSPGHQFASFDQQDCIEFLNFILDSLHEDLNQRVIENPAERAKIMELSPEQEKTREILPVRLASTIEWERYLKLNFSVIVDYFQGQYLSQLRCLECHFTSTSYNSFSILSLPIPEKMSGRVEEVLLKQCLDLFTETELLDDDNKWHCPRCQKFSKLTKKISITRFPRVLILHFKRFQMLPNGNFSKLDTCVTYPVNEILDLTSYWPLVGTYINSTGNDPISIEREESLLSSLPSRNQIPPFKYKLYGVVNHFGNLTTGHYTSYVRKESDTKQRREWCYFDDAKILYNCKPSQVLNKNAYCLFFQRV